MSGCATLWPFGFKCALLNWNISNKTDLCRSVIIIFCRINGSINVFINFYIFAHRTNDRLLSFCEHTRLLEWLTNHCCRPHSLIFWERVHNIARETVWTKASTLKPSVKHRWSLNICVDPISLTSLRSSRGRFSGTFQRHHKLVSPTQTNSIDNSENLTRTL